MRPRIGSLFAGYGGLSAACEQVFGGELAWYADCCKFDKDGNAGHYEPHRAPCSIMAHHYPDLPNLGDVTKVDWSQVEPVDILDGGSPCQDLSHAGKRQGMTEGTRSNLWVAMREAIAQLRPAVVVWENVRGAYSAGADSALEFCAGCMGDPWYRGTVLRALGRVLGDLSDLGYDARWHGIRAADVGAPHGRFRVFVVASDAQHSQLEGVGQLSGLRGGHDARPDVRMSSRPDLILLPTPDANADKYRIGGDSQQSNSLAAMARREEILLPTPAVNDMGAGKTVEDWDAWTDRMKAEHGNGNGHGKSLSIEAQRLLPTPTSMDTTGTHGTTITDATVREPERRGQYSAAIARWEAILRRPAPAPTQTSSKGNPQLSPRFVEWMMGLAEGWVTDVPGITRNEALKALGNGVCPQQAAAALRTMLSWRVAA